MPMFWCVDIYDRSWRYCDLLTISSQFPALGKFHAEPHCLPRTLSANQNDRLPSSRSSPTPIAIASIVSLLEFQGIWEMIIWFLKLIRFRFH